DEDEALDADERERQRRGAETAKRRGRMREHEANRKQDDKRIEDEEVLAGDEGPDAEEQRRGDTEREGHEDPPPGERGRRRVASDAPRPEPEEGHPRRHHEDAQRGAVPKPQAMPGGRRD